jgi:hypothetical protein
MYASSQTLSGHKLIIVAEDESNFFCPRRPEHGKLILTEQVFKASIVRSGRGRAPYSNVSFHFQLQPLISKRFLLDLVGYLIPTMLVASFSKIHFFCTCQFFGCSMMGLSHLRSRTSGYRHPILGSVMGRQV